MKRFLNVLFITLILGAMVLVGCKKNNPPDKPLIPSGPSTGSVNVSYNFLSSASDPEGDSIAIRFAWGNGDTSNWSNFVSSGITISFSHVWSNPGTYPIRAQAKDIKNALSDWSDSFVVVITANQVPNKPVRPIGPTSAPRESSLTFSTTATDPDNDSVAIRFAWGDGDTSEWSAYVPSGDTVAKSHIWSDAGVYQIRAQAKDKKGATSEWSEALEITIIGNRVPYTPATPTGPTSGRKDSSYTFSTVVTDPDGDAVVCRFAWGNGDTSNWSNWVPSGTPVSLNYAYHRSGTYSVRAQAKDVYEALSPWSNPLQITIINLAPNTPEIPSGPSVGEKDTSYNFSSSATDPDGDSVAIRFSWGDGDTSNWSSFVPSGTSVSMAHSWSDSGTYLIKAQAKDKEGTLSSWSSGQSISIEIPWHLATSSAGWRARYDYASTVFNNKIWVLGGESPNLNDVWYSSDGVNWTQATAHAGWSERDGHTSVTFNNKIWVLGGGAGSRLNDVWYSSDGVNWTQATAHAGWSGRKCHATVVFDNKIWVLGGNDGSFCNDVWYSSDGVHWIQATANAGWSPRAQHASVIFDNKIWILGGNADSSQNDVWYSSDGVHWTQATANAGWSARIGHTAVVFNNKIWILGGCYPPGGGYYNDVWYSSDGVNWICATGNAEWSARFGHTSVVFDNRIWVLGGHPVGSQLNDVWYWP